MTEDNSTQEVIDRALRLLPNSTEPELVVLKGHLLVEETLQRLLCDAAQSRDHLEAARLGFMQRLQLARAFSSPNSAKGPDPWRSLEALNSLRNTLVHKVEPDDFEKKADAFIFARFDGRQLRQFTSSSERTEALRREIAFLLGYLEAVRVGVSRS